MIIGIVAPRQCTLHPQTGVFLCLWHKKRTTLWTVVAVPSFGGSKFSRELYFDGWLPHCFGYVPRCPLLPTCATLTPYYIQLTSCGQLFILSTAPECPLLNLALIVIVCKTAYKPRQNAFKVRSNRVQKPQRSTVYPCKPFKCPVSVQTAFIG